MNPLRGPGRGRAFFRFLGAVVWLFVTYFLADKAAHGFSRGAAFPLIRNAFQIFMLIVGFGYLEMAWDRSREPLKAMGLATRPGGVGEFGLGAALGWGMVTVTLLIIALGGHFYVQLWAAPRAWGLLILQILTLAVGALAGEIAFRGYPFQKLVETIGPFGATILAAIIFGLLRWETPGATPTAMWISAVGAILLSVAYLRTHALWLCWGLHFAWMASIGILFGQPLAGDREVSSVIHTYVDGPLWLTGSEFGPEGSLVTLIVLWLGLYLLIRITRDLAWKYSQPELKPAGIPVDLSHPMHPAPPPAAASGPATEAPRAGLIQIAPVSGIATSSGTASPATVGSAVQDSARETPSISSERPSEGGPPDRPADGQETL